MLSSLSGGTERAFFRDLQATALFYPHNCKLYNYHKCRDYLILSDLNITQAITLREKPLRSFGGVSGYAAKWLQI